MIVRGTKKFVELMLPKEVLFKLMVKLRTYVIFSANEKNYNHNIVKPLLFM